MMGLGEWGMQGELSALWQLCFHEPPRSANYFFHNYYRPENCAVYKLNGKIVSMLHMLPAGVLQNGEAVPAVYIYGVATHPDYRSHGYSASLLAFAALTAARRGAQYAVLLPSNAPLYGFYSKNDFQTFYRIDRVDLTSQQLRDFVGEVQGFARIPDYRRLVLLRNRLLNSRNGSLLIDERALCYADGLNRLEGGKLVCIEQNGALGYALCRGTAEEREVTELMADDGALKALLAALLRTMPAKTYRFRLPEGGQPFSQPAKSAEFGMIRALGGATLEQIQVQKAPYLGLTKD